MEVAPAGGKWWRLKYRIGGKEKRLSLGTYPDTSLADAAAEFNRYRSFAFVSPLGTDRFGQTGDLPDLYRTYRLDAEAIIDAMAELFLN